MKPVTPWASTSSKAEGAAALRAELGALLLREDRNFHTIQCIEAAFQQHDLLAAEPDSREEAVLVLVAAARYLAAHAPTMRAQGQTFGIARRLHRNEKLFEGGVELTAVR